MNPPSRMTSKEKPHICVPCLQCFKPFSDVTLTVCLKGCIKIIILTSPWVFDNNLSLIKLYRALYITQLYYPPYNKNKHFDIIMTIVLVLCFRTSFPYSWQQTKWIKDSRLQLLMFLVRFPLLKMPPPTIISTSILNSYNEEHLCF
jgi:hypothetical protein